MGPPALVPCLTKNKAFLVRQWVGYWCVLEDECLHEKTPLRMGANEQKLRLKSFRLVGSGS